MGKSRLSSDIRVQETEGVSVIAFVAEKILEDVQIRELGENLFPLVEQGDRTLFVLNFDGVSFLSSAMFGKLLTLQKKIRSKGGRLRLCNLMKEIYEAFRITRLHRTFDIDDSLQTSLRVINTVAQA
jgi:anti-anti-sigma factor